MSSATNYNGTNILVHIHDPDEANLPSIRFEMPFFVGVFIGVVFLSGLMVAMILLCSKRSEKSAMKAEDAKKRQSLEDLKSNLSCKPWSPDADRDDKTEKTTDPSETLRFYSADFESISSCSTHERRSQLEEDDEEMQMQEVALGEADQAPSTPSPCQPIGESTCTITMDAPPVSKHKEGSICPICCEEYQCGEPVYTSNNCGHQCHKACMDKWLNFQNSCPVCNDAFVLRVV